MRSFAVVRRRGVALLALLGSTGLSAATFQVGNEAQLRDAIEQINGASGTHFIEFSSSITLTERLPPILNSVTLRGNDFTLSGDGQHQLLFIGASADAGGPRILVNLNDLELSQGNASGGDGADGGGGGMGAGGAVFVNSRADVVVNNVVMAGNVATGGNGAAGTGGGAGGLGGDGGSGIGGGGGGLEGSGGSGGLNAGGGGALASGDSGGGGLGAGGAAGADGEDGTWSPFWIAGDGGDGSDAGAGNGGSIGGGGGGAGTNGAGGGGGFGGDSAVAEDGGSGGLLGGGGGATGAGAGGAGGFAGGGGGAINGIAGDGGFAGGGGGSAATAGGGGFGGGGGSGATGGDGGFGGGGGAGVLAGSGGAGGGDASATGGGGGAGFGGAIFVAEGGGLTVSGSTNLSGNSSTAGSGASGGADGSSAGGGLFLQGSGTLQVRGPTAGQVLTLGDDISDAVGAGLAGAASFDRWNLLVSGVDRAGEVHLTGNNSYSGDTFVSGATLVVLADENLGGANGTVILDGGGMGLGNGFSLGRDVVINSGGGHFAVAAGSSATLAANVSGRGSVSKEGEGDLVLAVNTAFEGLWAINAGRVVIDANERFGSSLINVNGGGLLFSDDVDDMRLVTVGDSGAVLDNGGNTVTLDGGVLGSGVVSYRGAGQFLVDGPMLYSDSAILAGTVIGRLPLSGNVDIAAGANWLLGGVDASVGLLQGEGSVGLGTNTLVVDIPQRDSEADPVPQFSGVLSGSGQLVKEGEGEWWLLGNNVHTGGTRISEGVLGIANDSNLGNGDVILSGGVLGFGTSYTSNRDIVLDGGGGLGVQGSVVQVDGDISGSGDLFISGLGSIILNGDNDYTGDTIVVGEGVFLGIAREEALGNGRLELSSGGGLLLLCDTAELRPIHLSGGGGTVNTGGFDVVSSGGISADTGEDGLIKVGSGRLTFSGSMNYDGLTQIREGILQIGQGGAGGSIRGDVDISSGAQLLIDRSGEIVIDSVLSGGGSVLKDGDGTLLLQGSHINLFTGGLTVQQGYVGFDGEQLLGIGPVRLDGGGLLFGSDLRATVQVDAGGGEYQVATGDSYRLFGDTNGIGALRKTGEGELIVAGVAEHQGGTRVVAGTLQIGEGLRGVLVGDVEVDAGAALAFGRDDVLAYAQSITGEGEVIKRGLGELIFTGDQVYQGLTTVESGVLRLGLGGTSGSVAGDVHLHAGTTLIFDRLDNVAHATSISGDGELVKNGAGIVALTGDAAHTGGTTVNGGALQIGVGGTSGQLAGDVLLNGNSRLIFNRSDSLILSGTIGGNGNLIQAGSGSTVLQGVNGYTGDTIALNGWIAADGNNRFGSGELILDGGGFRYEQAFNDLRGIRLGTNGGAIDTNGFDVVYGNFISGVGPFEKTGAGTLAMTGLLAASDVAIRDGVLEFGAAGTAGALLADVHVETAGTLSFNRTDPFSFAGALTGDGRLRVRGPGLFTLAQDNPLFSGTTEIMAGTFLLNNLLGGDMDINAGRLIGAGQLLGNLSIASTGEVSIGDNSTDSLQIGGDLSFSPGASWSVDVQADGSSDRFVVGGDAALAGDLKVQVGSGDFANSTTYRIVTANQVAGAFDSVVSNLVFLTPTLQYGSDFVDLTMQRNSTSFIQVSLTQNQKAVAGALDAIATDDPLNAVVSYVEGQDLAGTLSAYDSLNGDSLLAGSVAATKASSLFARQLQMRSSRLGVASRGTDSSEGLVGHILSDQWREERFMALSSHASPVRPVEGGWLQVQQVSISEDSDGLVGNAAWVMDGTALSLGVDGYWRNNLIVGAGIGTMQADIGFDNRAASGDVDALFAGVYGRWDLDAMHVKAALSSSVADVDMERSTPLAATSASSTFSVASTVLSSEIGYSLHSSSYGVRPFVRFNALSLSRDAFEEDGIGGAELQVSRVDQRGGEFGVGVEVSRPWLMSGNRWAQLQASLTLLDQYGDVAVSQQSQLSGTAPLFEVRSATEKGWVTEYGLGGEFYIASNSALWLGLQGRQTDNGSEAHGLVGFSLRW